MNEMSIDSRVDISAALYFRIHNASLFGGSGSVGYAIWWAGQVKRIDIATPEFVEGVIGQYAAMCGCAPEEIDCITCAEYRSETGEDIERRFEPEED